MPMEEEPVVGALYEDLDGVSFEVLDFDEDDGVIEVQYSDGSVSEIDLDAWYEMDLKLIEVDDDAEDSGGHDIEKDSDDEDDDLDDDDPDE